MKLKLVGNGTVDGTRLVTESGEVVEGVLTIDWKLHKGVVLDMGDAKVEDVAVLTVQFWNVPMEIESFFKRKI